MTPENTSSKSVILYQTHFINDFVLEGYRQIKEACAKTYDVIFFYDTTFDQNRHLEEIPEPSFLFNQKDLDKLPYRPFKHNARPKPSAWFEKIFSRFAVSTAEENTYQMIPGNREFAMLYFFQKHPEYSNYWLIEYDVRCLGDWRLLLDHFQYSKADLLATRMRHCKANRPERWRDTLLPPRGNTASLREEDHIFAFLPLMRISRGALVFLQRKYEEGWSGHQEVILPSLLRSGGFEIEDIGGISGFARPENKGRFYDSAHFRAGESLTDFNFKGAPPRVFHPVKEASLFKTASLERNEVRRSRNNSPSNA